jgi:ribosomal-protein-alanine N-acetyltransferase
VSRGQTDEAIAHSAMIFRERRFGLWIARAAGTNQFIGFAGVWPFRDPPELELVYGVAEERWGQGFAPEIAGAVVDYCFNALGMSSLRASTDSGNAASVRVLEKLGFSLVRRSTSGGRDTVFFERHRGE